MTITPPSVEVPHTAGSGADRPAPPRPAPFRASAPLLSAAVLLVESALVAAVATSTLPFSVALLGHGAVMVALALALQIASRRGQDVGPHLLLLPAVAVSGPFGALGGLLLGRLSRRGRDDVERLEDWYRRLALSTELDPTAQLADHVVTGRALDTRHEPTASIADLLVTGSIAEKQAILGVIARRFHPDYLPGLQRALVADEPVIRVQAAAVAAKIRGQLPAYVDRLLRVASEVDVPPDRVLAMIDEARRCVASGLLEAKDRDRSNRLMDGLMARTMLRLERRGLSISRLDPIAVEAFADHLLESRRHEEFRRLRRTRRWAVRGPWVWRPRQRTQSSKVA